MYQRLDIIFLLVAIFGLGHQEGYAQDITNVIPTVSVNEKTPNTSSVGVTIPAIMNLNNNNQPSNSFVDLSVLGGLVTVYSNKTRDPSGQSSGPVTVSIFGIPVYVGNTISKPPKPVRPEQPSQRSLDTAMDTSQTLRSTNDETNLELLRRLKSMVNQQSEIIRELKAKRDSLDRNNLVSTVSSAQIQE